MDVSSRPIERGGTTHIIWDIETVSIPPSLSPLFVSQRLSELGQYYGRLESFKCICNESLLPSDVKQQLQESGVEMEEFISSKTQAADVFIVTRLLRLALTIQLNAFTNNNNNNNTN